MHVQTVGQLFLCHFLPEREIHEISSYENEKDTTRHNAIEHDRNVCPAVWAWIEELIFWSTQDQYGTSPNPPRHATEI
jgi:hypothetical protein